MGYPMGATGLYISSADMVKLGQVYLEGGTYLGKRILSEEWVRMALEREYAFEWNETHQCFAKGGMCGQMLMFSKNKRFAAAWHSYTTDSRLNGLTEFIEEIF